MSLGVEEVESKGKKGKRTGRKGVENIRDLEISRLTGFLAACPIPPFSFLMCCLLVSDRCSCCLLNKSLSTIRHSFSRRIIAASCFITACHI